MDASNPLVSAQRGRRAVAAFFFINGFIVGSWAAQVPSYIQRLGVTEATFGLMVLGFGLGSVCAMPAGGLAMSRFGSRPVVLPLAVCSVVTLPLAVLAPNAVLASLALFVMGAMLGGMDVAMNANAVTVERRLARPIMSSTHGFWSLGGFAGGVGGFVIQAFGPVVHALFVSALTGVLLAAAWRHIVGGDRPEPAVHMRRFAFPTLPTIYVVGLIALICVLPEATMRNWGALFMEKELGVDIGIAGLAFACFAGAMALMRFLGDGIRRRFGAVRTLQTSCLLAGLGMLCAFVAPWPALALACFTLAGLGAANMIPIAFSAAGNHEGMAPSTGMSVVTTMTSIGVLGAPWITGLVAEHTGIAPVFAAVAVMLLVAALLAPVVHRADFRHR
ncbi:MAG: MFS transporter [Rhizobiaceae bacterium]|jgi:predicted MFS family arabinose efflux permease